MHTNLCTWVNILDMGANDKELNAVSGGDVSREMTSRKMILFKRIFFKLNIIYSEENSNPGKELSSILNKDNFLIIASNSFSQFLQCHVL